MSNWSPSISWDWQTGLYPRRARFGKSAVWVEPLRELVCIAEIAQEVVISPETVRNHITSIFSKLQLADRAQAIIRAREAGLQSPARSLIKSCRQDSSVKRGRRSIC